MVSALVSRSKCFSPGSRLTFKIRLSQGQVKTLNESVTMQSSTERKSRIMKVSTVFILLFIIVIEPANGVIDYCDEHTFQTNTSHLQFTKEISDREYAMANNFKGLHCCAKGYRSIEWYKDGMAYPWPSGVSNLILYPESANQTVYARTVSTEDSGNYTCTVRNDSHVISHSVILTVLESEVEKVGYTGSPLPTYEPRDQYASRGETIRFFCEAFVGHIDLPDAKSEVRWWRGIPSGAEEGTDAELKMDNVQEFLNSPNVVNPSKYHHLHRKSHTKLKQRLHQETVPREESQVLGAYLLIHDIQTDDFGEYRCAVKNAAGEHTLQMSSWLREEDDRIRSDEVENVTFLAHDNSMIIHIILVFMTVILFTLLLMLVLNWKFDVLHVWKNRCRRKPDLDGKYDLCIVYESKKNTATHSITAKDSSLSHILPTSHCGYQCFTQPMPSGDSSSEKVFVDIKA